MLRDADFFVAGQQITRLRERVLGEVASGCGMTRTELEVLLCLAENPRLDTARELVEYLMLTKSCVSKAVDSLVRQGYLSTREDAADRRIIHLTAEEKAGEAIRLGRKAKQEMEDLIQRGVSDQEIQVFRSLYGKVLENTREALKQKP